jgi:serine/threonine-protein kinase
VDAAIYWMIGAARGLDHAWSEHRVIHRDIKPDNLLVGEDLRLKIVDFGIARQSELAVDQLTTAGMIVGSVRYMSPEQAYHPTEVDNGADLYSLGATFYHLLAGVAPFEGPNPMQILVQHAEDPPVPLVLRRPNLLPDLGDCVGWLLAKQRSSRPASARELLDRLFRLAETVGVDPDSPPASVRSIVTGEPATPADAAARVAPATGPTKVQRPPH